MSCFSVSYLITESATFVYSEILNLSVANKPLIVFIIMH